MQNTLEKFPANDEFISRQTSLNKNLEQIKKSIMIQKKRKFEHDVRDFKNNKVYSWNTNKNGMYQQTCTKSILKLKQSRGKTVTFSSSEYETSDPNTDLSDSEHSF